MARTRQPPSASRPIQRHQRVAQAPPAQSRLAGEVECVGDAEVTAPEPWEIFGADLFEPEEGIVPPVYGKRVYLGTPELPQRAGWGGPERREDIVKKWNAKRKADAKRPPRSADEPMVFKFVDENGQLRDTPPPKPTAPIPAESAPTIPADAAAAPSAAPAAPAVASSAAPS
ncbi:hypothetical protein KEM55_003484, partial [Ascosphaera atra]